MKNTLTGTLILGIAWMLGTPQAHADDEGWAAFGGLLGGAILTHAAYQSQGARHVTHSYEPTHHHHRKSYREPSGHYEYRKEKVWVPGHYDWTRDDCGRRIKVFHPGHYKYETVKVWVPHRRSYGRSCDY